MSSGAWDSIWFRASAQEMLAMILWVNFAEAAGRMTQKISSVVASPLPERGLFYFLPKLTSLFGQVVEAQGVNMEQSSTFSLRPPETLEKCMI